MNRQSQAIWGGSFHLARAIRDAVDSRFRDGGKDIEPTVLDREALRAQRSWNVITLGGVAHWPVPCLD